MKALLIGGTGTISMEVTRLLASKPEWDVFLLNRGNRTGELPANVAVLQADVNDEETVRRAIEPHRFDVVADFIAYQQADAERDVRLFSGRAGRYIFVGTASAYHKPVVDFPITESTPLKNPFWRYSRDKIACEDVLWQAFRTDGFPLTVVRPSHTYDDRGIPLAVRGDKRAWQTLVRIRKNKPVVVHGDGTSLWTLTHAADFAVGFAGLMENPDALGHAVNVVGDDVLTWNRIYDHIGAALGVTPRIVHIASDVIERVCPARAGTLSGDKAHSVFFDNRKLRRLAPEFATTRWFRNEVRAIVARMDADKTLQEEDPEFDEWCDEMCARYGE